MLRFGDLDRWRRSRGLRYWLRRVLREERGNVTLNSGSGGATCATDTISAVDHQLVKVEFGSAGSATQVSGANPFPENVVQLNGTTVDTNSGTKSAGTQRVVLATDQPQLTAKLLVTPDSIALPAHQSTNVDQWNGTTVDTNSGVKSAGTVRVVIATDQPQLTNKLLVTPDSVALPPNQSVNVSQFGGTNVVTGTGSSGAGIPRVTVSSDSVVGLTSAGVVTFQASQVSGVANATTTRTISTALDVWADLIVLINITNAGVATGNLQLFLEDSVDSGTTWDDLISSPVFAFGAALTTYLFTISGRLSTSRPQGQAAQQETLAASSARQGPFGERIRVREKVSGISGSPTGVTYTITGVLKR